MSSEKYSQNDLNSLHFFDIGDDVNSLGYNKYENPYPLNIMEKYGFEPDFCGGFLENPKSNVNTEDEKDSKNNEKDNSKRNINDIKQNENKVIYESHDFSSNYRKQSIQNSIKSNDPSEPDKSEKSVSTNPSIKKMKKRKEKGKNTNKKVLKIKAKKIIMNTLISYMNDSIKKVYGGKIGEGVIRKIIRAIKSSESENVTINHNRQLLYKTLKEIFSEDIGAKYTSVLPNNNKIIINDLLNEENEDKRKKFNDLFNKTFRDWVLMLSEPKGELKDLYEKELYKRKKKDENEVYKINEMIKNFEVEFLNIRK